MLLMLQAEVLDELEPCAL